MIGVDIKDSNTDMKPIPNNILPLNPLKKRLDLVSFLRLLNIIWSQWSKFRPTLVYVDSIPYI
jgi:hypothetical protein